MYEFDEMLSYVKQQLESVQHMKGSRLIGIPYNKIDHTKRVYAWMQRIVKELSPDIEIQEQELHVATIFHDSGYGILEDRNQHAKSSVIICRDYLFERGYSKEFIERVEYLVANHSNKEMLGQPETPIELIILMEADLLDDMGALGIIIDTMLETKKENVSLGNILSHIEQYTAKDVMNNRMVTPPAKNFWKKKQELTVEFVRQLREDIDILELQD